MKLIYSLLVALLVISCHSSKSPDKEELWNKYSDKILQCSKNQGYCCNELYPILKKINSIEEDYLANNYIAKCYCLQENYDQAITYAMSKDQENLAAMISYYFLSDSTSVPFLRQEMSRLEKSEPSPAVLNDYYIVYAILNKPGTYKDFLDKITRPMMQYENSNITLNIIEKSFNDIDKGKWICNL